MSNKWDALIEENVPAQLEHRIQVAAEHELQKNKKQSFFKNLIFLVSPMGALAAFLLVVLGQQQNDDQKQGPSYANAQDDLELLDFIGLEQDDTDLLADLDFFEDFDILEDWDGREEG